MKKWRVLAVSCAAAIIATGCSTESQGKSSTEFTMAITSDPGALDPMKAARGVTKSVLRFAYDALVAFKPDGTVEPWLAAKWTSTPTSVTYNLNDGITCSDGTPLKAGDVAASINHAVDPTKGSDYLGELPEGLKATSDDTANSVTVAVADPDAFLIYKTGAIMIVCPKGLKDPGSLGKTSQGTGMFTLTEAVPDDHYSFKKRADYTWGPGGVTSKTKDLPSSVDVRVVANESTAANLFRSGELNSVNVVGADRERVKKEAETTVETRTAIGLTFFNQRKGRPGGDVEVRRALTMATDLGKVGEIMTDGQGIESESLVTSEPNPCQAKSVPGNLPKHDVEGAKSVLDKAGWKVGDDGVRSKNGKPLKLRFVFNTALGDAVTSAAELLEQSWEAVGAEVTLTGGTPTSLSGTVYETSEWEAGWLPVTVGIPSDFVPRLSGTAPPKGANFASVSNETYDAEVAKAAGLPIKEACTHWVAAEEAIVKELDVVPVVDATVPWYGKGATFEIESGLLLPGSVRMTAK